MYPTVFCFSNFNERSKEKYRRMLNATYTCRMYGNTVTSGNTYGNHPGTQGQFVGAGQR